MIAAPLTKNPLSRSLFPPQTRFQTREVKLFRTPWMAQDRSILVESGGIGGQMFVHPA